MENPQKYYCENVVNGLNLLKVMLEVGVKVIIFSSSAATYGNPHHIPITEEHPTNPINTYGETKLIFEHILKDYARAYGLKYISLRYFNAAGADPQSRIGERHNPETHLIPLVLDAAAGIRNNIKIYGSDYETEDGTCIRDYIHILDLAEAHVLALKKLFSQGESGIYNLGTGKGNSVREIIHVAEKVTGKKIPCEEITRRPGDPPVLIASSERAKKELSWEPAFEDIYAIIETAWNWHRKMVRSEK
ncbi:MAG: UDP-glucose 4-epimerase [bacterium ADurb.Bin363]|nr:MAG: UDP-glucose 4-epimerase [bacterium ADurb.Bin363]